MSAEPGGYGPNNCDVCARRYSFGCGHDDHDEAEARAHRQTTDHLLGDCECFVSRPGYAARFTREQRRDNIAHVLRLIEKAATTRDWPGPNSEWDPEKAAHTKKYLASLYDELYRDSTPEERTS